jgi:hypothetical protein
MKNKLTEILTDHFNKSSLETLYKWDFPKKEPPIRIRIPKDVSNFKKNIFLKENLCKEFNEKNFITLSYWIVKEWGGIPLKETGNNTTKIENFKKKLDNKETRLLKHEFGTISSLSKIASFYKPKEFVIYDSRVIYSLNWLIFKNNLDTKLFPQPSGRNSAIAEYDQKTIFNLSNRSINYWKEEEAYFEYCKLLNETAALSKGMKNYELEMFLFSIADTDILDDIKNNVTFCYGL